MNVIDRLAAIEDIKQLKARYLRSIDTKEWVRLEAILAPDATFDVSDDVPGCVITGAAEILKMIVPCISDAVSIHHGHSPEIELSAGGGASGVWTIEEQLHWPDGSDSVIKSLHGYSHYYESYRRINGLWRIQSLRLKRLRVDIQPLGACINGTASRYFGVGQ